MASPIKKKETKELVCQRGASGHETQNTRLELPTAIQVSGHSDRSWHFEVTVAAVERVIYNAGTANIGYAAIAVLTVWSDSEPQQLA